MSIKTVLYLNHAEADYGGSFLFNGLCHVLGDENVWDYPLKLSYHGEVHHYQLDGRDPGLTAPCPWMPSRALPWEGARDDQAYFDEITRKLRRGEFDLVVVESFRPLAVATFNRLKYDIRSNGLTVIAHDGEDFDTIQMGAFTDVMPRVLLKREMTHGQYEIAPTRMRAYHTHVEPFPFSWPEPTWFVDACPRIDCNDWAPTYDVAFSCGRTWEGRQHVADALRLCSDFRHWVAISPDDLGENVGLAPWPIYLGILQSSQMGINVRGYGYDTVRFWETAANTVLVTERLPLHMPAPFNHGSTCLMYDHYDEVVPLIREWKNRPDELTAIYRNGYEHLLRHHTNRARAQRALQLAEEHKLHR